MVIPQGFKFRDIVPPGCVDRNAMLGYGATVLEQMIQSERVGALGVSSNETTATRDGEVNCEDIVCCEVRLG